MTIAEDLRFAGLSLANMNFVKLNVFFPVMGAIGFFTVTKWVSSELSTSAVNAMPVAADKVPYFVVAVMPLLAVMCAIAVIFGLAIKAPNGYESQSSRLQKAPGAMAAKGLPGWLDRVQDAQYNTFEAAITMVCSFFVASSLNLEPTLYAKLATLVLLLRVAYPFAYGMDIDIVRTQLWLTALIALVVCSFGALFPETVLPLFGCSQTKAKWTC